MGRMTEHREMECPHCKYFDGWSGEEMRQIDDGSGHFYEISLKMERSSDAFWDDTKYIYGCPKCAILFIN